MLDRAHGSATPTPAADPRLADWLGYLTEGMALLPEPATVVPDADGDLAYWQLVPDTNS